MSRSNRRTVTVLFSDMVGSTAQRTELGDDAAEVVRREHDQLLGEAIEVVGGRPLKNTGDGLMAVFESASDAVSAAVLMQRTVHDRNQQHSAVPFEIRIGLSAGDVTYEDEDCFGTPVVETARLCGAAEGGQILVSQVVRLLAGSAGNHQFEEWGDLALKGLQPLTAFAVSWERPEHVAIAEFATIELSV